MTATETLPPAPTTTPIVLEEFEQLVPPLTDDELDALTRSIAEVGCRDPLVVWRGRGILLDGHNRLRICRELLVPYRVVEYDFATEELAHDWIIDNQLSRRNLSPDKARFLRGLKYLSRKGRAESNLKQGAGSESPSGQNGHSGRKVRDEVAHETGVSSRTLARDAEFTKHVTAIAESAGAAAKALILNGKVKLRPSDVAELAAQKPTSVDEVKAFAARKWEERKRQPTTAGEDRNFFQRSVTEILETYTEGGVEYVRSIRLQCGHEKRYKRRVRRGQVGVNHKSAVCYECGSGTRTPYDRRREKALFATTWARAVDDPDKRKDLERFGATALKLLAFQPADQRMRKLLEDLERVARVLGLFDKPKAA